MDIHLEVPSKDEWIIDGIVMRVIIHKESLNIGLKILMLLVMVDLLWWY